MVVSSQGRRSTVVPGLRQGREWRVVIAVECDVFVKVLYGYAVYSLVGESELEYVGGFADMGSNEDHQLVGEIEKYSHAGTQRGCSRDQSWLQDAEGWGV